MRPFETSDHQTSSNETFRQEDEGSETSEHRPQFSQGGRGLAQRIAIAFAVLVYFALLIKLGGVSEEDLRRFPKGYMIVRFAKKFRLL